jgi:hypothetical protein
MPFDQVRFLTHQTRSEWLPSIFGSGSVMTAYDRWKSGVRAWNMSAPEAARKRFAVGAEFPGVFMSWHLGGERCLVAGDVVMVFPRDLLLEQRNFHLNVCDKNGFFIEGGTFFGGDAGVPDLAATRRGKGEEGDDGEMNEVVFHDSVPARLCVKMYCADPEKARRALPSWWKGRVLAMPDRFPSRPVGLPRGLRGLLDRESMPCRVFLTDINYTGIDCLVGGRKRSSDAYVRRIAALAGYPAKRFARSKGREIEAVLMKDGAYTRAFLGKDAASPGFRHAP